MSGSGHLNECCFLWKIKAHGAFYCSINLFRLLKQIMHNCKVFFFSLIFLIFLGGKKSFLQNSLPYTFGLKRVFWFDTWNNININFRQLLTFCSFFLWKQNSRTKEVCNDVDCESENENRTCQNRKRSSDQISTSTKLNIKSNSPPHQSHVKCIDKLQQSQHDDALSKNGHYELVSVGKIPSEPSLRFNSTVNCKLLNTRNNAQWHPNCEKNNELKSSSMTNINLNINNNNDGSIGSQQLGASNLCTLRTRTHTKSLSTRISSLKRESKTTRTLSIVMFRYVILCWMRSVVKKGWEDYIEKVFYSPGLLTLISALTKLLNENYNFPFPLPGNSFIACWLPFFILYLLVSYFLCQFMSSV